MKSEATILNGDRAENANFSSLIKMAIKELSEIRKANKATDAEIRRLQASTRKKLDRIWENLRHVEATH